MPHRRTFSFPNSTPLRRMASALCVCSAMMLSGCGQSGPALSTVSGKVTLDGNPVPGAILTFIPQTPGSSPSYGGTDANGQYKLMFTASKAGAVVGEHHVEIATTKLSKKDLKELQAAGEGPPPEHVPIPKKYQQDGALTATVSKGNNEINFALTSN